MKRIKLIGLLIMVGAMAGNAVAMEKSNGITITAGSSKRGTLPVAFETHRLDVLEHLSNIEALDVYQGECLDIQKLLKQRVACISDEADGVSISVPLSTTQSRVSMVKGRYLNSVKIADAAYKAIFKTTGSPFSSKLAVIAKNSKTGDYQIRITDYDGSGAKLLHQTSEPILSPTWSKSGRYLAYVSFETVRTSIFIHDTVTGKRIKALSFKGLNAYPDFVSDTKILVSLSNQSERSLVFEYDLLTKQLRKITESKLADIFPQHISDSKLAFVRLNENEVPYAYTKNGISQPKPLLSKPLNAVSTSNQNTIVGLSRGNLVHFEIHQDKATSEIRIDSGKGIESPSISSNGELIVYVKEVKGKFSAYGSLKNGDNIFMLKSETHDLIQVSAF
ncbi:PD40 domain-containing protein [Vibrio alginolyticus]|uniref:PD40 domain-containing protein n=1 Tax=Vibrio alginolyticus TaxID=663 RepID=UPI0006CA7A47|nr:PD40 domain-containing protein [Vibrio alginolyticus]CAH7162962.1 conserved exported hypothetical protein [Vibrio chagasii]CAH7332686.1 conserved exported hypothetical protein [Vibrio chagasii]